MKILYKLYLLRSISVCFLLLAAPVVFSQAIHSSVDKKEILIGQQVSFRLSIDVPSADYRISLDIPDSIPHFEILQKTGSLLKDKKGNLAWEQKIVFTSFDSGTWRFPSLNYRVNHLNTASQPLLTDSFSINVGYMPLDAGGKPRDIKTIMDVSYFDWFWVWIGAGALLLIILLILLIRYLKKRKATAPPKSSIGAYDEAMKRLSELKKANTEGSLSSKEYHTALADVLKTYYTKSLSGNLLNKTSSEILAGLRSHELRAETQAHAAEALQTGDAVKFAKYLSTYTENEAALDYLKNVIDEIESSLSTKQ